MVRGNLKYITQKCDLKWDIPNGRKICTRYLLKFEYKSKRKFAFPIGKLISRVI